MYWRLTGRYFGWKTHILVNSLLPFQIDVLIVSSLLVSTPGGSDMATRLIPAPDPTPAGPTSGPAAPPPPQDRPIAPQGPGQLALLCSQIGVWCHVFESGIGGSSVLCVILCRYACRIGDSFVRSWARSLIV